MRRLAQLIIGTNLVARVQGLQTSTTRSKKGWEYQWWWLHWLHGKERAPQSRTRSQFGSCSSSSFQSLLIFFNRFEKLGEVAFPKTPTPALLVLLPFLILEHASNPLNYLYKYGGPAHFTREKPINAYANNIEPIIIPPTTYKVKNRLKHSTHCWPKKKHSTHYKIDN